MLKPDEGMCLHPVLWYDGHARFLERLAVSQDRDNFIIKGGMLVTASLHATEKESCGF
jgi:hypothetical protein